MGVEWVGQEQFPIDSTSVCLVLVYLKTCDLGERVFCIIGAYPKLSSEIHEIQLSFGIGIARSSHD